MRPKPDKRLAGVLRRAMGEVRYLDYSCNKGWIDRNQYYNQLTELLMARKLMNSATCIDVGCHRGEILDIMIRQAPQGMFYAFEPLPHLYEYLVEKYRNHPNVTVLNIALSDTAGHSEFNYVVTNPGYSGFKRRRYDNPDEEDRQITVETGLVDGLFPHLALDLMKVDVEGAELQVLRGARETIMRGRPFIVFEHGLGAADRYGTTPEQIFELLCGDCDLNLNLINRYLMGLKPLTEDEFCSQFHKGINFYFLAYGEDG